MLDENTPCPREYTSYRTQYNLNVGSHGGCLIYVRRDIPHYKITLNTPLQAVAVEVHLKRKYTLCSLYLPPNSPVTQTEILDLLRQLPRPFLLMGDLNARHPLWGDVTSNQKGNLIASIIENEDLGLLNTGEPTHYHIQTGTVSCLDLTVTSSNCAIDFRWRTNDDWHNSDHAPIIINTNDDPPAQRSPRWVMEKADWNKFEELSEIEGDANDFPIVDDALDVLNGTLHTAGINSIPKTTGLFRRRPVPWWSEELRLLHRATRTSLTRYRRHQNIENMIIYKQNRARFRKAMKAARRQCWASFVSSINRRTPVSSIWKKIGKIAGKFTPNPPPVLKVNNNKIADAKDISNKLGDHFALVSKKTDNSPGYQYRRREELQYLDFTTDKVEPYNLPFTKREFDAALASSNNTAPGPDDIPYEMFRHISKNTKSFVISIINRLWHESSYPTIWELAYVLPFVKPGKDPLSVTSYRPIALTCCLCKLMEKMINTRFVWYLEQNSILSPSQCGFRKMRSTIDVLMQLETSICEAFASKQHHITIFFDIEKAYDTAWRYGILKTIHECGLRGELPQFIKAFLTHRFFQVKVGNTLSDKRCQEEGVPQGSVLSVTLFALAINGVDKVIPRDVLSTLFVDDLSISFAASRMTVAERKLQLTVNKIVGWAENQGFKISATKTTILHFCHIRGVHPDPDLYLYGRRIPCVEEARFLGLIFDKKLSWLPHLKNIKTKCLEALNILKVVSNTNWGADREVILKLHRALIVSKLLYGCEIYSSASPNHLKLLDSIHHSGVRLATGAFRSSPISSLLIDAGEIPLELYRQSSIVRYWFRIQRTPNSRAYAVVNRNTFNNYYVNHPRCPKPFSFRIKNILETMNISRNPVCPVILSITPVWKMPVIKFCKYFKGFKRDKSDSEIRGLFLEHANEHSGSTLVFTDGSKSEDGVGYGVFSEDFRRRGALPNIASNFTAELYGILTALEHIVTIQNSNSFTIFSDSKSALQSLEIFNPDNPITLKIQQWVFIHNCRGNSISLCWVPAHVNIRGNEKADQLAKLAASSLSPRKCALPHRDFFSSISKSVARAWQLKWNEVGLNKMREITTRIHPWKYDAMPRKWEVVICRLRIGHSRLTHGHLMSNENQPFCDDCLVPLTIKHIVVECPSLMELRERHFSDKKERDGTYNLAKILGEEQYDYASIIEFLKDTNFLDKL